MKKINITINGINPIKKVKSWIITKQRANNPMIAANMIFDFLKDKGMGYAIAAIPDGSEEAYLFSTTGLFVEESCINKMVKKFLADHPDFSGQIYSDQSLLCYVPKEWRRSELVYETSIS